MTKKNMKEFVKDHKREIVIGCLGAAAVGVLAYVGLRKPKFNGNTGDMKKLMELCATVDKASVDNTHYLYMPTEDVEKVFNTLTLRDSDGKMLAVTKAIAFGTEIVEETEG